MSALSDTILKTLRAQRDKAYSQGKIKLVMELTDKIDALLRTVQEAKRI